MSAVRRRLLWMAAVVVGLPLLAALPIGSAQAAATRTVTISTNSFSPNPQNAVTGDSVRFRNSTNVQITLTLGSNWPGAKTETVAAGATSSARKLIKAATYSASARDALGLGIVNASGKVVVKAPKPVPSATKTPAPKPTTAKPKPSATTSTGPNATPSSRPSSGVASGPPIIPGISGSPAPSGTPNPAPSVAPPPTDVPVKANGDDNALVQPRPARRLGLPGALAAVLVLGLLFGVARVLLAYAPPARRASQ